MANGSALSAQHDASTENGHAADSSAKRNKKYSARQRQDRTQQQGQTVTPAAVAVPVTSAPPPASEAHSRHSPHDAAVSPRSSPTAPDDGEEEEEERSSPLALRFTVDLEATANGPQRAKSDLARKRERFLQAQRRREEQRRLRQQAQTQYAQTSQASPLREADSDLPSPARGAGEKTAAGPGIESRLPLPGELPSPRRTVRFAPLPGGSDAAGNEGDTNDASGPAPVANFKLRSNTGICVNAVKSPACLGGGAINQDKREAALASLQRAAPPHCVIVLRDPNNLKFRGLYATHITDEGKSVELIKFHGAGPRRITADMAARYFRYDSGAKDFRTIPSRDFGVCDAVALHANCWPSKRVTY